MASKSVSKSVIWQLVGKFALQGIAFFTTPIFTRILTPEDYGYTALYGSWESILSLMIGLQTLKAIGNARIKYESEKMAGFLSSIMTISVISFGILFVASIIFNDFFASILGIRKDLVVLLTLHSFGLYIISFCVEKFDQHKQPEKSTLLSCSQSLIAIACSLLFVLSSKGDKAVAKIYGNAVPMIIYGCVLLVLIYAKGRKFWVSEYNSFCIKFSSPLIVHAVASLIFSQSDRIMLNKMQGGESLGIYSVAFNLSNVITIIMVALCTSWTPFYYDYKKNNDNASVVAHGKRLIKLYTIVALGFILLSYDVFKLMAPVTYWNGMKLLPFFVVANYFHFMYGLPANCEFFSARTKLIPVGTVGAAVINVFINWLLIPRYGIIGAAIGTVTAFVMLFIFHECMARFVVKTDYEWKNPLPMLIGILVVLFFCGGLCLVELHLIVRLGLAILLGVYAVWDILKHRSLF